MFATSVSKRILVGGGMLSLKISGIMTDSDFRTSSVTIGIYIVLFKPSLTMLTQVTIRVFIMGNELIKDLR